MRATDGFQKKIWDRETLQRMDWRGFEHLCAEIFRALDYEVQDSGPGPDGGIDLVCKNDTRKFVVQCKREADPIKAEIVRQLGGCIFRDQEENGVFITTGTFSDLAKQEFENHQNFELVDGEDVLEGISEFSTSEQEMWHDMFASDADWDVPSCPKCDLKMYVRVGRKSGKSFWGCPNYGKLNCQEKFWPDAFPICEYHRH